jgi:transposase InsO family protein
VPGAAAEPSGWPRAGAACAARSRWPPPERHLAVDHPGELVQLDCFCIGRLQGTKGTVWQYTAVDVASAYTWATLQVTPRNPSAAWTSQLAQQVAADLATRGWTLERVMSDNASEFRSATFQQTVARLEARHSFIRAGRPQTNGCVERVQQTILDECWKPAFARYLIPKQTGLRLDLERYLRYYNTKRGPHRPLDQGPNSRARPRKGEAVAQETLMRRHNPGTAHPRTS